MFQNFFEYVVSLCGSLSLFLFLLSSLFQYIGRGGGGGGGGVIMYFNGGEGLLCSTHGLLHLGSITLSLMLCAFDKDQTKFRSLTQKSHFTAHAPPTGHYFFLIC